jgi:class 3 adenylate cyclase
MMKKMVHTKLLEPLSNAETAEDQSYEAVSFRRELRLLMEEMCCHLFRFRHEGEGHASKSIKVRQEFYLGKPGAFADVRVETPGRAPYFVEVKLGYTARQVAGHLARKYADKEADFRCADRLLLIVEKHWPETERQLRSLIEPRLKLEIWDKAYLLLQLGEFFDPGVEILTAERMPTARAALDHALGRRAFGTDWSGNHLQSSLLWHFGYWKLQQLRQENNLEARSILPPGMYSECVVLMADICSYSSYVRDTRNNAVVRDNLTAFYSKARYEIQNSGGMLYQFVGDEVIGLFGIPRHSPGDYRAALECARSLTEVGCSISNKWQRHIDRVQQAQGVHIGMAVGDLQVVSLKSFDLAYVSAVSDAINMASRLLDQAGQSEIVVSNSYYLGLDDVAQAAFRRIDPVDGRSLGTIHAWKCGSLEPQSPEATWVETG